MSPEVSTPPGRPTGVAIIGLGVMGTRMLASLSLHDGFDVVSAWDPDPVAREAAESQYADIRLADSALDAIGADSVELVYIATPPHAHYPYAQMAADAGLAVYCEKPLGVDLAESEELVRLFRDRSLVNVVNFPFAANRSIDHITMMITNGSLGEVLAAEVRLHFVPWPREWQKGAAWLAERADGGFLREVGSHFVFLVERLFGSATVVDSSVEYPQDGRSCETEFAASLDCGGVPVSLAGSAVGVGPDVVELTIWGSKQSVRLSDWSDVLVSSGGPWETQSIYGEDMAREHHTRFFGDLQHLVEGRANTMASFQDALSVQRIVETILAAPGS